MSRYIGRGLRVFCFYLAVLAIGRLVFCLWLQEYWAAGSGMAELGTALWLGTRLSIQTAGVLALLAMVPAGLVTAFCRGPGQRVERFLN